MAKIRLQPILWMYSVVDDSSFGIFCHSQSFIKKMQMLNGLRKALHIDNEMVIDYGAIVCMA